MTETRLKTILFDMGNVLVHFCHERMCRQIGELCGRSAAEVRSDLLDSALQWRFERGQLTGEELHSQLIELWRTEFPQSALERAAADIFELNAPIVPVLDELRQRGLRLVLLSNTCVTHYDWVRSQYDVLDRFDQLVLSYQVGAIKPEERIYRAALEAIDCAPAECLYVDDIPAYVEQGRRFGLQAEVFTGVPTLRQHLAQRGISLEAAPWQGADAS